MSTESRKNRGRTAAGGKGSIDRRTLLTGTASAAGMVGTGLPLSSFAQTATTSSVTKKRIDAHTHFSSLKYIELLEKQEGRPFVLAGMYKTRPSIIDAKVRLDMLDRNEIDLQVLVPLPWLEAFPRVVADRALAVQAARFINDEIAAVVAAEPKRFRGVALLPTFDSETMVAELHRAVKELGFVGGYVAVGHTAKPVDHPDFEALYKAVADLDVTLWLHPSQPPLPEYAGEKVSKYHEWIQIGWPYDTTSAMYRIVFAGVFDRYPGIRIVTHHHGGFVPYYAARMAGSWEDFDEFGGSEPTKISKPYINHFKKFYCDTACNNFAPKVLELALDFFGPERVMYGSDAPFGADGGQSFMIGSLKSVQAMQISPEVRSAILSGNASRILKMA